MSSWSDQILHVNSADPDTQRRGHILIGIALATAALALAFVPLILTSTMQVSSMLIVAVGMTVSLIAAYLGRRGQVTPGSYLLIGIVIVALLAATYANRFNPSTPMYLVLPLLLASVLLPPIQIWSVLVINLLGIALVFGLLPAELRESEIWGLALRGTPLILIMSALIVFISAHSLGAALAAAQAARLEAEVANRSLAESNTTLEARVAERTAELSQVLEQQQRVTSQLEESLAAQRDMNRVIAELSVPIIPVSSDSLVVPLVGAIDSARAEQLLSGLLSTIEEIRAHTIILDVTGVAVIDTQVAATLLRVAAAAGLMGARTVLVGIRPEVAQTLVGLGIDLDAIHTAASLQDGLALVTRR